MNSLGWLRQDFRYLYPCTRKRRQEGGDVCMPVHSVLFAWQLPRMDAAHSCLHRVGLKKGAHPEPRQRRAGAVSDTAPCLLFLLAMIKNGLTKGSSK